MTDQRTVLFDEHKALGGRIVPFAGFEMPVQYAGVMKEHEAVRTAAGLFDVSHMGEFLVTGKGAAAFLKNITTNDTDKLTDGRCQYNVLCYDNGTVVDDIIVSRQTAERYFIVVNAGNIAKDFAWLKEHKPADVELADVSQDYGLIAVQGPKAAAIVEKAFGIKTDAIKYYHFAAAKADGVKLTLVAPDQIDLAKAQSTPAPVVVSRTGYTGEDGFEVLMPNALAVSFWRRLLEVGQADGLTPAGLGARDTLRLEAAYPLYGHEINDATTPLEAGLGWVVKPAKGEFVGSAVLTKQQEQGIPRKLVGIELSDGIARDGAEIFIGTRKVGHVTSGTFSPTFKKAIGLALIASDSAAIGTALEIDVRGKRKAAQIVVKPFYKKPA